MNNPHIIVGPNSRCLCGLYGSKSFSCQQIIAAAQSLYDKATAKVSADMDAAHDAVLIYTVLETLIQDRPTSTDGKTPSAQSTQNKP